MEHGSQVSDSAAPEHEARVKLAERWLKFAGHGRIRPLLQISGYPSCNTSRSSAAAACHSIESPPSSKGMEKSAGDEKSAAASAAVPTWYRVGDLVVDAECGRVTRDSREILLGKVSLDLLLALVRGAPGFVSVDSLLQRVWPGMVVGPETVAQRVKLLRSALDDDAKEPRYIAGVRGRGYRLVAPVTALEASAAKPSTLTDTGWDPGPEPQSGTRLPRSIAVLPFANLTAEPDKEYFGDGMAEELINVLSQVPGLKVPARTSSFAYKGRNLDVRRIARDLGVETVLEGSVRSAGERIRVVAQLVDAKSGFHVWSHSWDRRFEDLFKVQDQIAAAIVQALGVARTGARLESMAESPPTHDLEAYQLYLQGQSLRSRVNEQNLRRAVELFEQASARDPKFGRAVAAAVMARANLLYWGFTPCATLEEVERDTRRALELDPSLVEAHALLGLLSATRGRWVDADRHCRRSLSTCNPDPYLRAWYAIGVLQGAGHLRQSLAELREAYRLAPADSQIVGQLAQPHMLLGHDADALRYARLAVDLGMSDQGFLLSLVQSDVAMRSRRYAEAAQHLLAGPPTHDPAVVTLVYSALADASQRPAALAALHRSDIIRGNAVTDSYRQFPIIMWYTNLGALDLAYEAVNRFLDRFSESREIGIPGGWATLWQSQMRAFRLDRRFQALATRLGLMDYWKQFGPPDEYELTGGQLRPA
jgi:TolB-like protein